MSRNVNGPDWEAIGFAAVAITFLLCYTAYEIAKLYA